MNFLLVAKELVSRENVVLTATVAVLSAPYIIGNIKSKLLSKKEKPFKNIEQVKFEDYIL